MVKGSALMRPVLAIFAKTPRAGTVKTRMMPFLSPEGCAELYRCMLLDTVCRVGQLPVTTVIFYAGDSGFFKENFPAVEIYPQQGGELGERLEHAFGLLAELGYTKRVVMGTDSPDLPRGYLEEAFRLLDAADTVFGPAEDGGYYLIGLKGESAGIFRDISWSTPAVLCQSLERVRLAGRSSVLLPRWYDVDSSSDLFRPGLADPENGAPLTRRFLAELGGNPSVAT